MLLGRPRNRLLDAGPGLGKATLPRRQHSQKWTWNWDHLQIM